MSLRLIYGLDEAELLRQNQVPVQWQEDTALNAHMLVVGKSGTGKSHTLRRIASQIIKGKQDAGQDVRIHVFDVQGDLDFPKESKVLFSESTNYGINPLRVSSDPHFGGVRKRVQSFIDMVNDSSRELGSRQTSCLRAILYDLYELHGFRLNDPQTWSIGNDDSRLPAGFDPTRNYIDIPFEEKDQAKEAARRDGIGLFFDSNVKCWHCERHEGSLERWPKKIFGKRHPTLLDAARYAANRLRALAAGGGSKSMRMLEEHNRKVAVWHNKAKKLGSDSTTDIEAVRTEVQAGAMALIETFTDYVMSIETGKELENLIRYDSIETVKSLVERLETMIATGIYKSTEPPFDPAMPVWNYRIAALDKPEQRVLVWTQLTRIFDEARARGPLKGASEIRDVIVLDEAQMYFAERESNILDIMSREARKYGISLVCASQSPTHFSEDFLANVGTKILLGIDSLYYDQTVRKMKIDLKTLECVIPKKIAAIQVSSKNESKARFIPTRVG